MIQYFDTINSIKILYYFLYKWYIDIIIYDKSIFLKDQVFMRTYNTL